MVEEDREWYKRKEIIISPNTRKYTLPDMYSFDLWTNDDVLLNLVRSEPYVLSTTWYSCDGTIDKRNWHHWVTFIVRGKDSWEAITGILDNEILGEVWGETIASLV